MKLSELLIIVNQPPDEPDIITRNAFHLNMPLPVLKQVDISGINPEAFAFFCTHINLHNSQSPFPTDHDSANGISINTKDLKHTDIITIMLIAVVAQHPQALTEVRPYIDHLLKVKPFHETIDLYLQACPELLPGLIHLFPVYSEEVSRQRMNQELFDSES